jgi:hypothetical protein
MMMVAVVPGAVKSGLTKSRTLAALPKARIAEA